MKKALFIITLIIISLIPIYSMAVIELKPSLKITEKYSDNIFLTPSDEEDDFITEIFPYIFLKYKPNKRIKSTIHYGLKFKFYARHNRLNETDIDEIQRISLGTFITPSQWMSIEIYDVYQKIPIDIRKNIAEENEYTNMISRNILRMLPYIKIPITPSISSKLGYEYVNRWYKYEKGNDSESHTLYISIAKRFPLNLDVSLNYNFTMYRPELTEDVDTHKISINTEYTGVRYLKVWGGIGKYYLDYQISDDKENTFWNAGGEMILRALGNVRIGMEYTASILETSFREERLEEIIVQDETPSVSSGLMRLERVNLYLEIKGEEIDFEFNPYYSIKEEINAEREDKIKGIKIVFSKQLLDELVIYTDGSFEWLKFRPEDNKADRYSTGFSIDYILSRYVTLAFGYRYNFNDDDQIDEYDYTNNIIWVQGRLNF